MTGRYSKSRPVSSTARPRDVLAFIAQPLQLKSVAIFFGV